MNLLKKHIAVLIVAASFITTSRVGICQEHVKFRAINDYLSDCHEAGALNGAVLVAHNCDVIYKAAFGLANREWEIPNTVSTKFNLASVTKMFTALVILQLVEEGKLELASTISTYLPEYRADTGSQVTLHHLLTHTSGIPDFARNNEDFMQRVRKQSHIPIEFMSEYCSGDLLFEPGAKEDYSNSGYIILGMIIERVTGRRYVQVMSERVFEPLGMTNSGAVDETSIIQAKASGYINDFGVTETAPYMSISMLHGAGVLYSTVEDMHRWNIGLRGTELLSQASKQILFKPLLTSQACGWRVGNTVLPGSKRELVRYFHGGGMPGFLNLLTKLPEDDYCIVFLTNSGGMSLNTLSEMNNAVIGILYDEPYELPPQALTSVAATLYQKMESNAVEEAVEQYHQLKRQSPQAFDYGATALHNLAVRLTSEGRRAEARAILRLNSEDNSDVYWTHMSLAKHLLEDGDHDEALVNAKKALEMKPNNERVISLFNEIESN